MPNIKMTNLFEQAALAFEVDFREHVDNMSFLLEYIKHLHAVSKNGWLIKKVPDEYKTRGLYFAAVSNNGNVLKLIPDEHKDYSLCWKAIKTDGLAYEYVPDKFCTEELMMEAFRNKDGGSDPYEPVENQGGFGNYEDLYEMELEESLDRMTGDR